MVGSGGGGGVEGTFVFRFGPNLRLSFDLSPS